MTKRLDPGKVLDQLSCLCRVQGLVDPKDVSVTDREDDGPPELTCRPLEGQIQPLDTRSWIQARRADASDQGSIARHGPGVYLRRQEHGRAIQTIRQLKRLLDPSQCGIHAPFGHGLIAWRTGQGDRMKCREHDVLSHSH